jgi:hypothetical protein
MSVPLILVSALAAGAIFIFVARKMSLSWLIAGGGGFIAVCVAFITMTSSMGTNPSGTGVSSAVPIAVRPIETPQTTPSQADPAPPQQQPAKVDTALRQRCVEQAKTQHYRSGQCAYTFIDTCMRTQSRAEMEAVLRTDTALSIGEALSCPNMPTTFAADFDKF